MRHTSRIGHVAVLATLLGSGALAACGSPDDQPCTPATGTICTFMGTGRDEQGTLGLIPTHTSLSLPQGVAFGPDGRTYVLDWNNHRILRVKADNTVEVVAGNGMVGSGPVPGPTGPPLECAFNHPTGLSWDAQGRMTIAAWHNSYIQRVDFTANTITTIYGTGGRAFGGDNGPAAMAIFNLPVTAVYDSQGNLLISDQANQRIRRVDTTGTITTVYGTGTAGFAGDEGPAAMAQFNLPVGQAAEPAGKMALDHAGNLYLADSGNNRIRMIDTHGVVHTVAGNGTRGYSGDGGPATMAALNFPADVAVAADGTLYIADRSNHCVRRVAPDHTISTAAGVCGMAGFAGDNAPATAALLNLPYGVAVSPAGDLYIGDSGNHRIRVVYH